MPASRCFHANQRKNLLIFFYRKEVSVDNFLSKYWVVVLATVGSLLVFLLANAIVQGTTREISTLTKNHISKTLAYYFFRIVSCPLDKRLFTHPARTFFDSCSKINSRILEKRINLWIYRTKNIDRISFGGLSCCSLLHLSLGRSRLVLCFTLLK